MLSRVCAEGVAPAEAFGYLGYAEFSRGQLGAAELALRNGLAIAPTDLTMSFYLARVLESIARQVPAMDEPERAAAAMAAAADAYCNAGDIAWNRGDYRSAGHDALRALHMESGNLRALYLAVNSFRALQRYKLALQVVERFLSKQPSHPEALGMKGVLLFELGNIAGSVEVLRAVPVNSPDLAWVRAQLAVSLSNAPGASLDDALKAAREAVDLAPSNPFAYRILGILEVLAEVYAQAAATLTRARELGDSSEAVALELGMGTGVQRPM